jgi:hypothetical protein
MQRHASPPIPRMGIPDTASAFHRCPRGSRTTTPCRTHAPIKEQTQKQKLGRPAMPTGRHLTPTWRWVRPLQSPCRAFPWDHSRNLFTSRQPGLQGTTSP